MDVDKLKDYSENRDSLVKKGRGLEFRNAVEQMDQYILDPIVRVETFYIQKNKISYRIFFSIPFRNFTQMLS